MEQNHKEYTYKYPRPAMTADCVIFGFDGDALKILLIERGIEPFLGMWALPGGFIKMNESIEECARRELLEETHVKDIFLEQFHCFSSVNRDPRGRVVTVAFIALVRPTDHEILGGDDATRAAWFNADYLPPLAFDHREIIKAARTYLKEQLNLRPTAFLLLDEIFTIDELQKVYEVISNKKFDRRNFHRKLLKSDIIEPVGTKECPQIDRSTSRIQENRRCEITSDYSLSNSEVSLPPSTEIEDGWQPIKASKALSPRSSKGRPPKFFRLISRLSNPKKDDDQWDNEENSIKNLFNF